MDIVDFVDIVDIVDFVDIVDIVEFFDIVDIDHTIYRYCCINLKW